jgi:chromosome partitioning protein
MPAITDALRMLLRRVIVCANGKGGVGKTSLSTNLAGILAAAGYKVLFVDMDPQGNAGINLGYDAAGLGDEGRALYHAVTFDEAPVPVKDIRPNLDVLPAGDEFTELLADVILSDMRRGGSKQGSVGRALAKIAHLYDVIMIDTPPLYPALLDEALLAARWVLVPTTGEEKNLRGLSKLAHRIDTVRENNETLALLGVVLHGVTKGATKMESEAREDLRELLGDAAPIFQSTVRYVPAADKDGSKRGQLAHELAHDAKTAEPFWKRLRGEATGPVIASSATSLAEDYMSVAKEAVQELESQEELLASEAAK